MTPGERILLEGLMFGLGLPSSSARRPAWMNDGACIEHPEVEFIPADQRSEDKAAEARAICSRWLCREDCLAYALADDVLGIWAGTTTAERRALRRRSAA